MAHDRPSTDDLVRPSPPAPRSGDGEPLDGAMTDTAEPMGQPMAEPLPETMAEPVPEPMADDLPLLDDQEAAGFLDRWSQVQSRFVDDPQAAVREGDSLVAEVMQALAQRFSQHKRELEVQWQRGDEPQTEELRLALQQYRSFFQRLLAT